MFRAGSLFVACAHRHFGYALVPLAQGPGALGQSSRSLLAAHLRPRPAGPAAWAPALDGCYPAGRNIGTDCWRCADPLLKFDRRIYRLRNVLSRRALSFYRLLILGAADLGTDTLCLRICAPR